jgi:alpha-tubulin suppressor-like RCC1 family protein
VTWGPEFKFFTSQQFGKQKIVQVECGKYFTVALTDNGQVYTWGKGNKGALGKRKFQRNFLTYTGHGDNEDRSEPTLVKDCPKAKQISCGNSHVVVLATNETMVTWGNPKDGRYAVSIEMILNKFQTWTWRQYYK